MSYDRRTPCTKESLIPYTRMPCVLGWFHTHGICIPRRKKSIEVHGQQKPSTQHRQEPRAKSPDASERETPKAVGQRLNVQSNQMRFTIWTTSSSWRTWSLPTRCGLYFTCKHMHCTRWCSKREQGHARLGAMGALAKPATRHAFLDEIKQRRSVPCCLPMCPRQRRA